jgi:two-component system, OmpR family, sensor histidine kinase ChvG
MAIEAAQPAETSAVVRWGRRFWRQAMATLAGLGLYYRFTSIRGRIITLNLVGLLIMGAGLLYLTDTRDALIGARIKSFEVEANIIARAIAANNNDAIDAPMPSTDSDPIGALKLELSDGTETGGQQSHVLRSDAAARNLRRLIDPARTHGFIFDMNGMAVVDSNKIYKPGQIVRLQQPVRPAEPEPNAFYRLWLTAESFFRAETLPEYETGGPKDGKDYDEVRAALEAGIITKMVRLNALGETILCVAAPIRRGDSPVLGALLLTTPAGELDSIVASERVALAQLFSLVFMVMVLSSLLMAGTIAGPMQRLAIAAERVRGNIKERGEIPDFAHRSDEIGHLSTAFREMTSALYGRLDAIESFAADVSHELKNPLTSLRSAADTLSLVKREEDRDHLVSIIQMDVKRLNRLITDISEASRLDAELARETRHPVNVVRMLDGICSIVNDIHREGTPHLELKVEGMPRGAALNGHPMFTINGHERRLSQVINNLLDNAISFSPSDGKIMVTVRHIVRTRDVEIIVEDQGCGIPADNLERIFERFYTYRPGHDEFGQNSGLGLNISRQIVEAHAGKIWAENRIAETTNAGREAGAVLGARFVIRIPARP